eukprot:GHVU01046526.1.p1 GENE.GHVU01046526.1~~GHVU01046526.1.p1  ORF type:complete len:146 (-),score=1.59 GHVU01046526.1:442-879(-)
MGTYLLGAGKRAQLIPVIIVIEEPRCRVQSIPTVFAPVQCISISFRTRMYALECLAIFCVGLELGDRGGTWLHRNAEPIQWVSRSVQDMQLRIPTDSTPCRTVDAFGGGNSVFGRMAQLRCCTVSVRPRAPTRSIQYLGCAFGSN